MTEARDGGFRVALVGRRLADNENLGLAYLRAALHEAGFAAETHVLNEGRDVGRIGAALLGRPPGLLGISLADGGSAFLPLALGELLAAHGYRGHVTAGGPFATLARRWLLERYAWLDSVVRFAGEVPLPELARRLAGGLAATDLPGITTREGDGRPAPVTGGAPLRLRPLRDELPEMLGHRAAHVSATRGCAGRCRYCGPAALQVQERAEGRRAGVPSDELDRCGVGGVRRRNLDDVCDEMAELWHGRDVRYFYFVDEHLLPYRETEALEFLERWRRGLERRNVGRFGIGGMLRADRLTPAVARACAELGLIRVFVGLEFGTAEEARRYGRRAPGERELELLKEFARVGVVTVSNLMLVHPYSTPGTLAAGIDFLGRLGHGSFEATRMMVYHGTRLHERMAAEGRLLGNPLRYGYRFAEPVVERFAELFSRLRGEVFRDYSIGYRTHDAHLALALRRRLGEPTRAGLGERLERVRREVNASYVAAFREALGLATAGCPEAAADALVGRMQGRSREPLRELQQLEAQILADAPRGSRLFAPMRAAAAGAISFCLVAGACGTRSSGTGAQAASGVRDEARATPEGATGEGAVRPPTPELDGQAALAAVAATRERGPVDEVGPADEIPDLEPSPVDASCPEWPETRGTWAKVEQIVHDVDPCFTGAVGMDEERNTYARAQAEWLPGSGLGLGACAPGEALRATEQRVREVLAARNIRCGEPWVSFVEGGWSEDLERVGSVLGRTCGYGRSGFAGFTILLDGRGRVFDVRATGEGRDAPAPELLRCIRSALGGLTFACLASMSVCSEWVIIE